MIDPLSTNPAETTSGSTAGDASRIKTNGFASHASEPGHRQEQAAHEPGAEPEASPQMARAEEMVDQIAQRVGTFTSTWLHRLRRAGTRLREEAEDIWGEAQSIRRGDQS